jgi:hypothetical protein
VRDENGEAAEASVEAETEHGKRGQHLQHKTSLIWKGTNMKRLIRIVLSLLLAAILLLVGYREMQGTDMKQVGVITDGLADALTKAGFKTHQPFDVFFPYEKPSQIGFIIAPDDESKLSTLDASIKTRVIPAQKCMVATFPWKNPASYIVGYMKVDGALQAYREKHAYVKGWAATRHDNGLITCENRHSHTYPSQNSSRLQGEVRLWWFCKYRAPQAGLRANVD